MKLLLTLSLPLAAVLSLQAATTIDLTTAGATSTNTAAVGGTFIVTQIDPQSTGTGVIDSFLRVQSNGDTEQGYNTSLGTPMDDKGGGFTRALLLSDIPVVDLGGTLYRQFLLDINQLDNSALLSLNQIQIFQLNGDRMGETLTTAAAAGVYPEVAFNGAPTTTQVFEMSAGGSGGTQYTVKLNYGLNPGSGAGDMFLYVPNSQFNASLSNVILYSQFGNPPGANGINDGFEEWAVLRAANTTTVPEPGSILLLGTVLLGVSVAFRKKMASAIRD